MKKLRIIKVLRKDIQDSIRPMCSMTAICGGVYLLLWILFTFIFGSGSGVNERKDYFWIIAAIFSALTPGTVYGYLNHESGKTAYLLLPASPAEKVIVMTVLSIFIYPVVCILILGSLDSLLTAVGGYFGSMWPELAGAGQRYLLLILLSSIFMFGNLQFKSGRIGKSAILTFTSFLLWGLVKRYSSDIFPVDSVQQELLYVSPPLLWFATYRKLIRNGPIS